MDRHFCLERADTGVPLISVILACKNAATTIRQCLDSLVNQADSSAEIIVMDGGSTDGTLETLREFQEQFSHFESKRDCGVYHAWNEALDHVRGEWVYFLGADDFLWTSDVFLRISPVLRRAHSRAAIVYGRVAVLDHDGAEVAVAGRPWVEASRRFFQGGNLFHQGVFHRRSLFLSRRFDTSFRVVADYDFLLGALSHAQPCFEPDVVIAGYRAGGLSNRPRNVLRAVHEVGRALKKHGHARSVPSALAHYVRSLGWMALLSGSSIVSQKVWRQLSRLLIQRSARGA